MWMGELVEGEEGACAPWAIGGKTTPTLGAFDMDAALAKMLPTLGVIRPTIQSRALPLALLINFCMKILPPPRPVDLFPVQLAAFPRVGRGG